MNRQLKRIEQVLDRLDHPTAAATIALSIDAPSISQPAKSKPGSASRPVAQAVSFELTPQRTKPATAPIDRPQGHPHPTATAPHPASTPVPTFVAAAQADEPKREKFNLPQFAPAAPTPAPTSGGFSRHQNGSNPDLALNLLHESLTLLQSWRSELQAIGQQIQGIYREGPVVDGWLECSTQQVEATTAVLRNAEVSQLMGYVESLCNNPSQAQPEYRLCGLSQDGRIWSSPCPQKQLASISLAISRHQKLQPLLQRKLYLEKQLHQAAELTAVFHGKVQAL